MILRITKTLLFSYLLIANTASTFAVESQTKHFRQDIVLKESVRVESDVVHIGDLFLHTGKKGTIAVAYAPSPGKKATFDANWLYRIAKAYQLDWRPMNRHHRVIVERTSTIISQKQIGSDFLGTHAYVNLRRDHMSPDLGPSGKSWAG